MPIHSSILKNLMAIFSGVLICLFLLFFLAKLPLNPNHKLYQIFGIKKPQIIGFQPFWLLSKADKPYEKYITTFTYFALALDTDGTIVKLVSPQEEEPGWTALRSQGLQEKLRQAKESGLILSLLVQNTNEASISALLENPEEHAQNLIADITPIMQEYGFIDLNLDIESFETASESVQQKYTAFVRQVKKRMEENQLETLTVEITPISPVKPRLTNVENLGQVADYIVLMAYDYQYLYSYLAGPVAPIGGVPELREYDVKTALKEILNVVPPEKIILGIPLYGYEWETISDKAGAPTIPGGGSTASNKRVEELLASCGNCIKAFEKEAKQPYIIFPDGDYYHQIYYEDEESIKEKLKLAKEHKIAGIALWALGYEGDKILEPVKTYKNLFDFDPSFPIIN